MGIVDFNGYDSPLQDSPKGHHPSGEVWDSFFGLLDICHVEVPSDFAYNYIM